MKRSLWLWLALVLASAIAAVMVAIVDYLWPEIMGFRASQLVFGTAAAMLALLVTMKLIFFFYYPAEVRFLHAAGSFVMFATVLFVGGSWAPIPFSELLWKDGDNSLWMTTSEATTATAVVLPFSFGALVLLVYMHHVFMQRSRDRSARSVPPGS